MPEQLTKARVWSKRPERLRLRQREPPSATVVNAPTVDGSPSGVAESETATPAVVVPQSNAVDSKPAAVEPLSQGVAIAPGTVGSPTGVEAPPALAPPPQRTPTQLASRPTGDETGAGEPLRKNAASAAVVDESQNAVAAPAALTPAVAPINKSEVSAPNAATNETTISDSVDQPSLVQGGGAVLSKSGSTGSADVGEVKSGEQVGKDTASASRLSTQGAVLPIAVISNTQPFYSTDPGAWERAGLGFAQFEGLLIEKPIDPQV